MKHPHKVTFTTFTGTLRPHHTEQYVPFKIDTTPIFGGTPAQASPMAPTATLAALDDTDTRRGAVCPMCFVEQSLTGVCGSH